MPPPFKEDYGKILVKINGNPAIALIDLQTTGADLINSQFVFLYQIPTIDLETPRKLSTAIKGSNSTIFKKVKVKLDWGGHTEDREFYMTHLAGGEDIILGEPALTANKAVIRAENFPVTIHPPDKEIITLEPWLGEVSPNMVSAKTNITINPSSN